MRPIWTASGALGVASAFGLLLAVNLLLAACIMDRNRVAANQRLTQYRRWKPLGDRPDRGHVDLGWEFERQLLGSCDQTHSARQWWPTRCLDGSPYLLRDAALVVDRQTIRRSDGGIMRYPSRFEERQRLIAARRLKEQNNISFIAGRSPINSFSTRAPNSPKSRSIVPFR